MASNADPRAAECRLPADEAEAEATCPRCGAAMTWTKASWHCLACRYKQGCCG
jgi:hypothetical protein